MNNRKNTARIQREQRKLDAGLLDAQFPDVAGIVIRMTYNQKGIQKSLSRLINFFPGSYALFRIGCLNRECSEGGFDFSEVITGMVRNHIGSAKGNLNCEGNYPSADHSTVVYEVSIQYT